MCGPRAYICLINIFSFGWRFSSGLSLEQSQQSKSLSAGMLLLEQGSQTISREIKEGKEAVGQAEEENSDRVQFK